MKKYLRTILITSVLITATLSLSNAFPSGYASSTTIQTYNSNTNNGDRTDDEKSTASLDALKLYSISF